MYSHSLNVVMLLYHIHSVRWNRLGDKGASHIASALHGNDTLMYLRYISRVYLTSGIFPLFSTILVNTLIRLTMCQYTDITVVTDIHVHV